VAIVGCVGQDDAGHQARRDLEDEGVNCHYLATVAGPTGTATILVDSRGENMIAVAPGANAKLTAHATRTAVAARLSGVIGSPATSVEPGAVVVTSLEVPLPAVTAAAEAATDAGVPFVLNPAPAQPLPPNLIARCAVLTPNEHELPLLLDGRGRSEGTGSENRADSADRDDESDDSDTGDIGDTGDGNGVARLLAVGAGAVVVTLGAQGARIYRPDRAPHHQPALPASVVDTTGAGDAFTAALAVGLAEGADIGDAVRMAAAAGAIAAEGRGARGSLPSRSGLAQRMSATG
jgi:ribokinase